MLPERIRTGYCNSYLLRGEEGFMLVDTAHRSNARRILRTIDKKALDIHDLRFIVLTHIHFDHVYGAALLKSLSGCRIIAHTSEADLLEQAISTTPSGTNMVTDLVSRFGRRHYPSFMQFRSSTVDMRVDDVLDLTEFGFPVQVVHTPGHTEGSITVIREREFAIVGDVLFGTLGIVFPPFANDLYVLGNTWEYLLSEDIPVFYTGHGPSLKRGRFLKVHQKRKDRIARHFD